MRLAGHGRLPDRRRLRGEPVVQLKSSRRLPDARLVKLDELRCSTLLPIESLDFYHPYFQVYSNSSGSSRTTTRTAADDHRELQQRRAEYRSGRTDFAPSS